MSSPLSPLSSPLSSPTPSPSPPSRSSSPPTPSTYRYTPTELGIFTPSPYKTALLPLWRFRTPTLARRSATAIYARFLAYDAADDFVGQDLCRKYLQMGMTRAKRYATYQGGRKYVRGEGVEGVKKGDDGKGGRGGRETVSKSGGHAGQAEKEEASAVFREAWERAKAHAGYVRRKEAWLVEQRRGDAERKKEQRRAGGGEDGGGKKRGKKRAVKVEME